LFIPWPLSFYSNGTLDDAKFLNSNREEVEKEALLLGSNPSFENKKGFFSLSI
jgi:phage portal protein BeeE